MVSMVGNSAMIEAATAADAPEIIALISGIWKSRGFELSVEHECVDLLAFEDHYLPPQGRLFVARDGGEVVASMGVERVLSREGELRRFYTRPDFVGEDLGARLLQGIIDWCRSMEMRRIGTWIEVSFEDVLDFLAASGWRRGPRRHFPDLDQYRYRLELDL